MAKTEFGKNMLLITSYWGNVDTFKMIPLTEDCPYAEVIYDPATTLLVVISKIVKENFQMVPTLDKDGNLVKAKNPKSNGKPFAEQRSRLNTLQEYYLPNEEEQKSFIQMFAVNAGSYDYEKFIKEASNKSEPALFKPEKLSLVDENGMPLVK